MADIAQPRWRGIDYRLENFLASLKQSEYFVLPAQTCFFCFCSLKSPGDCVEIAPFEGFKEVFGLFIEEPENPGLLSPGMNGLPFEIQ